MRLHSVKCQSANGVICSRGKPVEQLWCMMPHARINAYLICTNIYFSIAFDTVRVLFGIRAKLNGKSCRVSNKGTPQLRPNLSALQKLQECTEHRLLINATNYIQNIFSNEMQNTKKCWSNLTQQTVRKLREQSVKNLNKSIRHFSVNVLENCLRFFFRWNSLELVLVFPMETYVRYNALRRKWFESHIGIS